MNIPNKFTQVKRGDGSMGLVKEPFQYLDAKDTWLVRLDNGIVIEVWYNFHSTNPEWKETV